MSKFINFKGPAERICKKLGLDISQSNGWGEFTDLFQLMDARRGGQLPDEFLSLPGGTADTALIQAILHAADYSHCADKMPGVGTWKRLDYVSGEYASAIAATIIRKD